MAENGFKVLLVEDSRTQALRLQFILQANGFEAVVATNGLEALEKLSNDYYPIIITDWVMPELDGVALCRKLRQEPRDPYLPIILLTSREGSDHTVEALNSGADAFLTKPFGPSRLLAQIRVAERIVKGFDEALRREAIKRPLRIDYKACGFPEDAAGEEDFLDRSCPRPTP